MKSRHALKVGAIVLTAIILGFIAAPSNLQKSIFKYSPQAILDGKYQLGLDLQGGSQLDYKIDLRKVQPKDQQSIIDGVTNVINNRVNGLGVSEPNIYVSTVGDEKHLIVELAGIQDLEEAKKIVGKTIQLEFKEQNTDQKDATTNMSEAKNRAQEFLAKIKNGGDFSTSGREEQISDSEKVTFTEEDFKYKDEIGNDQLAESLLKLKTGEFTLEPIETTSEFSVNSSGQFVQNQGFYIAKLIDQRTQERTIEQKDEAKVSHILIGFKGAQKADASITRTEAEAQARAQEVITKLNQGAKFDDLAKEYSDDKANSNTGGVITETMKEGVNYAKEFVDASLKLQKVGDISPATKSPFGFHIIKADSVTKASTEKKNEAQVKFQKIFFNGSASEWKDTDLNGEQFVHADVQFNQLYQPYVSIQFNDEGAKLFEQITARNINKQVAIFVGGKLISAPRVNEKIGGGKAQISGNFTLEIATELARDLNTGAIPAPIILAGQNTIGASLGQDALNKSLWAGLIGFILVALFMIGYYRVPGILATIALLIYSIIMLFLIKTAIPSGYAIAISLLIFGFLISKILKSRDSGPEKLITLILACFILFFISFVLSTAIVMTLAGIAGVILSIGMAVDANILIFERIKEELRDGRNLTAAIDIGFDRAWNSIRDSNFSSLITCAILFFFGTSIIQGFAFNLAAGILVSMFTAITITKTLLHALINTSIAQNLALFGKPKNKADQKLPILSKRKITYAISLTLLIISILGIPVFGMKYGLDFTGGTIMELQFKNQVTIEQISQALKTTNDTLNAQPASTTTMSSSQQGASSQINAVEDAKIDLNNPHIVPSEKGFIIKTKHISTAAHDKILPELQKQLGEFTEVRFNTVGPTVGESLRSKAIMAIIIASLMIILYIGFAFRKIPKSIGAFRFGASAIIALLHDIGIMFGVYVYFGAFFGVEIDALFITAMLTILGFSVHDTIVVFDRIREKLKYQKRDETFESVANQAVNESITRSINTSFSVFLTLLAVAIFGAESIRFFAIILIVGIVAGTYSSIFVATPILVDWQKMASRKKN